MAKTTLDKVYDTLVTKKQPLTAKQIATRYGVANPHDMIYRLRNQGVKITLKTFTSRNGTSVQKYTVA